MFNFKLILNAFQMQLRKKSIQFILTILIFLSFSIISAVFGKVLHDIKIGFVDIDRILQESKLSKIAQRKIESEFKIRDEELNSLNENLKCQINNFEKNSLVMTDNERSKCQRNLSNLDNNLQRKQREFQEDLNRRRNEELSEVMTNVNNTIKFIAKQENYDLILQDAVAFSSRLDITDQIIHCLDE